MRFPSVIGVLSPTQMGDCICSLPAARYIKKIFPNSYSVAVLDPRSKELAPLLINHPDIDRIYINEKEEGYTEKEKQWVSTFNCNLHLFGHYVPEIWTKIMSPREANFRLRFQFQPINSPFQGNGWNYLTEEEKIPKLEPWFNIERCNKLIVLSPFVGYYFDNEIVQTRSPSLEWWKLVVEMLLKMGFCVAQIGIKNFPLIYDHHNFYDKRNLSLLESIKLALGADLFIGACGGMSFIINAYGQKSICPYTDWIKDATPEALLPVNSKNKLVPLFSKDNINNISLEDVEKSITKLLDS